MLLSLRTRSWRLSLTVLPFYVLMCFSTVYIYAHYAIDVIAGLVTGTLFYLAFVRMYKFLLSLPTKGQ
jgi:membrane-associated phospholipid phosphatase